MSLAIGLILPDVLGTYGDDGNALVLRQRARMRRIEAEIIRVRLGEPVPSGLDLYCLGGGEDTAQTLAADHLIADRGLIQAAAAGRPILAICAGLQVLGESFHAGGRVVAGVGLLDATTAAMEHRAIGEVASTPVAAGLSEPLTGFENHLGATLLGPDARPLGRVFRGVGNTDEQGAAALSEQERATQLSAEGVVQGSIIATYMHGPVLTRNPQLADLLLARALGIGLEELEPLEIPIIDRLRLERLS